MKGFAFLAAALAAILTLAVFATPDAKACDVGAFSSVCGQQAVYAQPQFVQQQQFYGGYGVQQFQQPVYVQRQFVQRRQFIQQRPIIVRRGFGRRGFLGRRSFFGGPRFGFSFGF